jgi:MSP (Major sperm protein) domain
MIDIVPFESFVCLFLTVTLQAQKEYPADMQCKDKFLIQSTKVAPSTDMDEIPADTVYS